MTKILSQEERVALTLLSAAGSLHRQQLNIAINTLCGHEDSIWFLERMKRRNQLFSTTKNSYSASPIIKPRDETIDAFWVMLQYIDKIELTSIEQVKNPAGYMFVMNGKPYRVVGLNVIPAVTVNYINSSSDDYNYIIIVENVEQAKSLPPIEKKHVFASIERSTDIASVTWLSPKKPAKLQVVNK